MTTDERLAEIQARVEKASPGPWDLLYSGPYTVQWHQPAYEWAKDHPAGKHLPPFDPEDDDGSGPVEVEFECYLPQPPMLISSEGEETVSMLQADAEFCAEARVDIPFLLDLAARWRPVVDAAKELAATRHRRYAHGYPGEWESMQAKGAVITKVNAAVDALIAAEGDAHGSNIGIEAVD